MPADLPLTERVQRLIREGKPEQAAQRHNTRLAQAKREAEEGKTINLSDLMASKQELDVARTT